MTRTTSLHKIGRLAGALLAIVGLLAGIAALSGVYADEGGTGDGGPLPTPSPLTFTDLMDREAHFESVNVRGHYIRHRFWGGEIACVSSEQVSRDATFIVRPALSGMPGAVSFEAKSFPGYFLRHQDFRLKLHPNDGSDLFRGDTSFLPRPGLAGLVTSWAHSFESVNLPGHFIRHRDFHLWVERDDGSALFRSDATFSFTPGEPNPPPFQPYPCEAPDPSGRIRCEHCPRPPRGLPTP